jgi:hypothetical protein
MKFHWLLSGVICVAFAPLACVANEISWTFQRTGFVNQMPKPQTALSMRSNLNWPVIFSVEQDRLNAYSLFSGPNANDQPVQGPRTNWHRIGMNLTQDYIPANEVYLQATSGSPDGFAVSVQTQHQSSNAFNAVVRGTSFGGFQAPLLDVQAAKFDGSGNLVTATNDTLPGQTFGQKVFDVAKSPVGDLGLISQNEDVVGSVTFWQKTRLLGDAWISIPLNLRGESRLFGASLDLAYDAASRAHVVGLDANQDGNSVVAYHFDIVSGGWLSSTLDTATYPAIADVAMAANDQGIVGAAWVNDGTLKYAIFDGNQVNPHWTVTTVADATPTDSPLKEAQGVGLAFDRSGLPVISFVAEHDNQIWIAYDPPLMAPVAGDFNHDGSVNAGDLDVWKTAFGTATAAADADGDGDSDGADFLAWQRNFTGGAAAIANNAAVPEPLALSSAVLAATLLVGSTRKPRRTAA